MQLQVWGNVDINLQLLQELLKNVKRKTLNIQVVSKLLDEIYLLVWFGFFLGGCSTAGK